MWSKAWLPPAIAQAEKRVMSVISCYNCWRLGHIARECRQRSSNELREPGSAMGKAHELREHRGRAELGRQRTLFDSREPGTATRKGCNIQKRNWIDSGNGCKGSASSPRVPHTRRY